MRSHLTPAIFNQGQILSGTQLGGRSYGKLWQSLLPVCRWTWGHPSPQDIIWWEDELWFTTEAIWSNAVERGVSESYINTVLWSELILDIVIQWSPPKFSIWTKGSDQGGSSSSSKFISNHTDIVIHIVIYSIILHIIIFGATWGIHSRLCACFHRFNNSMYKITFRFTWFTDKDGCVYLDT